MKGKTRKHHHHQLCGLSVMSTPLMYCVYVLAIHLLYEQYMDLSYVQYMCVCTCTCTHTSHHTHAHTVLHVPKKDVLTVTFHFSFVVGRRKSHSRADSERQRLIHKVRKEKKGAVREIRKDNQFLAQQKLKEQIRRYCMGSNHVGK